MRIMHLLRSCSPIAIFVAATLSSGAVAQAKPPVELTYEVYFGGFHIMSARAELSSGETDYNLQVESVSRGIADFFVSWKGQAKSNGLFAGDKAVPAIHRNDGVWKGKTRKVDIHYAPSGEVTSYSVEPEPDLEAEQDDEASNEQPDEPDNKSGNRSLKRPGQGDGDNDDDDNGNENGSSPDKGGDNGSTNSSESSNDD